MSKSANDPKTSSLLSSDHPIDRRLALKMPGITEHHLNTLLESEDHHDVLSDVFNHPKMKHEKLLEVMKDLNANRTAKLFALARLSEKEKITQKEVQKSEAFEYQAAAQEMMGQVSNHETLFEAARFLANGVALNKEEVRNRVYQCDGDPLEAALVAYNFQFTPENVLALRGVLQIADIDKSEPARFKEIRAAVSEAKAAAEVIQAANEAGIIEPIKFKGKHSQHTQVAKDPNSSRFYIVKPGDDKTSPAAGLKDSKATQSAREVAFAKIARSWGLEKYVPNADLVVIDGREVAIIEMLGLQWINLETMRETDATMPGKIFKQYEASGMLHRWAILDYVLGQADRHAGNIMVSPAPNYDVALIDAGSALAGDSFDPANDKSSFIPYYLRASAKKKFHRLSQEEKLEVMPRISGHAEKELRAWLNGIDAQQTAHLLQEYKIDPEPMLARLEKVRNTEEPLDLHINKLWVGA